MKIKLFVGFLAVAVMCSCKTPHFLTSHTYIGGRDVKQVLVPSGSVGTGKNRTVLYDYVVRVCDVGDTGDLSNCKDSTVLTNVESRSVY